MSSAPGPSPSTPEGDDRTDQPTRPELAEQETAPAPDPRPLSRFAERFRIPLGALVALIGLVFAVFFVVQPPEVVDGARGVVEHVAIVALWLCVAAAGTTWAIGLPRRVTNICAAAGVGCYAVLWFAGL